MGHIREMIGLFRFLDGKINAGTTGINYKNLAAAVRNDYPDFAKMTPDFKGNKAIQGVWEEFLMEKMYNTLRDYRSTNSSSYTKKNVESLIALGVMQANFALAELNGSDKNGLFETLISLPKMEAEYVRANNLPVVVATYDQRNQRYLYKGFVQGPLNFIVR